MKRFQEHIDDLYGSRDRARGAERTMLWLVEEIGELAEAVRTGDPRATHEEMADVLAWLASLANVLGVDLEEAALEKYGDQCPRCGGEPCACSE